MRTAAKNREAGGFSVSFHERIRRRKALWWEQTAPGIHGPRECHALRHRDDSEERWKCCPYWQRKLSNKWNAREFTQRTGCRVAGLYGSGREVAALPFDALPSHYVIRSTSGYGGRNVVVMANGRNRLDGRVYTQKELEAHLERILARGFSRTQLLVEEHLRTEDGSLEALTDYKLHVFGDRIAGIMTVRRGVPGARDGMECTYYDTDWIPFDRPMLKDYPQGPPRDPPACLEEMKAVARRLGGAYGTYVRIDLYATDRGPVFGEFSPTPSNGACFTPFGDALLDECWKDAFPDAV